ncbi:MAG: GerW family sporulation protein [Clostridia bacterium]|nr:GerW family sporulation protein [Clostridia bacterium]
MSDRPINNLMDTTLDKLKQMVDVNTVIGTPITTPDGTTIIPVSKVIYGFASGGSEFNSKKPDSENLFGGGSGAGVTITPIAFISVSNGEAKLLNISAYSDAQDRAIGSIPEIIDKITALFKKDKKEDEKTEKVTKENISGLDDPKV